MIIEGFSLFLIETIYCDPSSELSHQDSSDEGSQLMFLRRTNKNSKFCKFMSPPKWLRSVYSFNFHKILFTGYLYKVNLWILNQFKGNKSCTIDTSILMITAMS